MHHLVRRPMWYRYAIFGVLLIIGYVATKFKDYQMGWTTGAVPFWIIPVGAAIFTFAAMTEMSQTLGWNDCSIRMYPRWRFEYLGYKTFELSVAEIIEISAGCMSNETLNGRPFTMIQLTDGTTEIPIRTDNFFRAGMQELVADIARLRPDLELSENLQAYLRGDFDSVWPD